MSLLVVRCIWELIIGIGYRWIDTVNRAAVSLTMHFFPINEPRGDFQVSQGKQGKLKNSVIP
jgi:hypothetical protein